MNDLNNLTGYSFPNRETAEQAKKIKVIMMDVDGVMTGGMIVYDSTGNEIKHFNAQDGLGIKLAGYAGLKTGIISARESETIRKRATELGMDFLYLGSFKKKDAIEHLLTERGFSREEVCFIGDDLPDMPVIQRVGLSVAVANATQTLKQIADYVTSNVGGDGAVREVVELILSSQNKLAAAVKKMWEEG